MSELPVLENDPVRKRLETENRAKSGAGWLYWIAGLSMANSVIMMTGANVSFPVGLGITQIVDGFAFQAGVSAQMIGLILNALVAAMFVFLGVTARKGEWWAFVTGLVLYGIDGLLFLVVQDWLSIGFHAWGFIGILSGLKASNQLKELPPSMPVQPAQPTGQQQVGSFQR